MSISFGTAGTPIKVLALTTTAIVAGMFTTPAARAATQPHTSATMTSDAAVDAYWTPERMKNAKPLPMPRPASAPALKQALKPKASDGVPRQTQGSAPSVDVGNLLSKQLFQPDLIQENSASGVKPDNVGNFGAYFTTTRVFPDKASVTYPNSTAGRLYFSDPVAGGDYICSASAISPRLIVTAGHCTAHADPSHPYFYSNWMFVPSYNNGVAPNGTWKVKWATTTVNWYYSNGSVPNVQDVGVMVVYDRTTRGASYKLGNITGWLGTWTLWGRSYPNNITQLGYPCNLDSCAKMELNTAQGVGIWNNTVEIGSAMEGGSSGGPWIQDYGVAPAGAPAYTAGNWVLGVTSWGYTDTTQMGQGSSIFENAGYSGGGFGDLYSLACKENTGNC